MPPHFKWGHSEAVVTFSPREVMPPAPSCIRTQSHRVRPVLGPEMQAADVLGTCNLLYQAWQPLPLPHLCVQPCSSVMRRLPALAWRASTFWVTSQCSFPCCSQLLRARCATLGWWEENWGHPTKFLAQYFCRAAALRRNSACWTGRRSDRA